MSPPRIFTVGHSTRSAEEFVRLLDTHHITRLADVRTIPRSRRHPHFAIEVLPDALAQAAIEYRHFPVLGGLRKPRPDSPNLAWRNESFRGYADHMATPAFADVIEEFLLFASASPTAVMCAEAVWWRCHRALLADALVARGVDVGHILGSEPPKPHKLSHFARTDGPMVIYPARVLELFQRGTGLSE
ncbi:MAG: DUF488 domain-containing protein [Acidobacteria bacterium]|nr:DUF488 domain-containing protein [Acidobacteriota bacterium]